MNISKKKIYYFTNKYVNANNVKIVILFIPLLIIIISNVKNGEVHFTDLFSTSILTSFLVVFICELLADFISKIILKKCEDEAKLTTDYISLVKKYSRMMLYNNIPIIVLARRKILSMPFTFYINTNNKDTTYQLPKQISDNSSVLMKAHSQSIIYNNTCVRILECKNINNCINIDYMRTTYFDSLITNRAMDYIFIDGKTIREIYEPGPFLNSLATSKLSNHLGFNGFIELKDGEIIFVRRNDKVSIGKNSLGTSIGASFKTAYGVDDDFVITKEFIGKAIAHEINDELKIDVEEYNISSDSLYSSIFAFYRDLVEGGKPQFLFYLKINNLSWKEFINNFYKTMNIKEVNDYDKKHLLTDGSKFISYTIPEINKFDFAINGFYDHNKNWQNMMPSGIASIMLLKENYK